ncbi:adenine phosphoribosyltransferase [Verrucomicrobium sp. 3C]|uniref:adenine phosphoribosyltransferase n=1 Tax=Verrucomicrobium sp. 3C TaxID=1134055 RepID=UPI0003644473|nr:adenine phosphoribosyltransferase [Verrucomicrobium sp. 3C]
MTFLLKSTLSRLKAKVRTIPDFPEKGILYRDITPLVGDGQFFRLVMTIFLERYQRRKIDKIAAIDARGFIFAGALAHTLGIGLIPIRKKGKLPYQTFEIEYASEYGLNTLTIHRDAVAKGEQVLILDDVLATGGTAEAASKLVERCGGTLIELGFLIELCGLKGKERISRYPVYSILQFP